jgi:hypothetical protein
MLGLTLRKEFQGHRLKGTAIELTNKNNTGATQVAAEEFLQITYPSGDVLKSLEAIGPQEGRPLVLIGGRGQGKSHLMGALYHALTDDSATQAWLQEWGERLSNPKVAGIPLRSGMHVITESLHRQDYKFLWDLLLEQHPNGEWARGKWEGLGDLKTDVFPHSILMDLFEKQPTALILDEYQTWYDGLTNTKQYPWRTWAFNFIQNLSEIAKEFPDRLVLVVSVRNGDTDAFRQIHRVNPALVDFKGPHAKRDRQRLLLHRLFDNRMQVAPDNIREAVDAHVNEYLRLLDVPQDKHDQVWHEFVEAWPYAPHMTKLLEDQVLVATYAQETRDLIKILADLFKRHGNKTPIMTAADFRLDDEQSGIMSLLDSVANQHHVNLREKAQRNLEAVQSAVKHPHTDVPHLSEIVGGLWVRSLAVGNLAGAEPETLHVDITRDKPVDDNAFQVELDIIVENSFNIHRDGTRLVFKEEENPQAKLIASARNDKLFQEGEGLDQLAREIRYVVGGGDEVAKSYHVVVLPREYIGDPWGPLDESDHPKRWDDRIPILLLPEVPEKLGEQLGTWLKDHLQSGRNTVRFLIPQAGAPNAFLDRDLVVLARAVFLASVWKTKNTDYRGLHRKYQSELRVALKTRFDRFAILETWDYQDPKSCTFSCVALQAQGDKIPEAIDKHVRENLFVPEDFEDLVLAAAAENKTVSELLKELREPRPGHASCIPWLGETLAKEKLVRLCAKGKIAINLRGQSYLQINDGESEDNAWKRMRGRLSTGKHLDETHILLPQAVPQTGGLPPDGLFGGDGASLVGDGGNSNTGGDATADGGSGDDVNTGGGSDSGQIFDADPTYVPRSATPNSGLMLLARIQDDWGITPGTQVQELTLKVESLTGAQLKQILKALPDGMTYGLSLEAGAG